MAYVYQHVRMDNLTPYYIGVGLNDNDDFKRSKSISQRNKWWKNIYNKVETKIEIIKQFISWEDALLYEQFYIKLYGRRDKGGLLCNLTDGGEGTIGVVKTQSQINATILYNKTRVLSEESRKKISESRKGQVGYGKKSVLQFDRSGILIKEWDSCYETRLEGFRPSCIQNLIHGRGKSRFHKNFRWEFKTTWENYTEEEKQNIIEKAKEPNKTIKGRRLVEFYKPRKKIVWEKVEFEKGKSKEVFQFTLDGQFVQKYNSINSVKKFGFDSRQVSLCIHNRRKTHKRFIWKTN